jgi:isopentenyl-diphosphate delta-isomerase
VELARSTPAKHELFAPLALIGHTATEMVSEINKIASTSPATGCRQIIISGGIRSFLDGYYLTSRSILPSVFGQASGFLRFALGDYEELRSFITGQVNGLKFARAFLKVKS